MAVKDSQPCSPDVLLCCAVLCCAVLCCAVLRCAVLCCAVQCCAALRCAALCSSMLCCAWRAPRCSECLLVSAELTTDHPASTSGGKRKRNVGKGRGCWKQPWQISRLYLDTEALLTALQTGLFFCMYPMHAKQLKKFAFLHPCMLCVASAEQNLL